MSARQLIIVFKRDLDGYNKEIYNFLGYPTSLFGSERFDWLGYLNWIWVCGEKEAQKGELCTWPYKVRSVRLLHLNPSTSQVREDVSKGELYKIGTRVGKIDLGKVVLTVIGVHK